VLTLTALAGGASVASAASPALPGGNAVVALRGASEVTVPGIHVDAVLSAIHSELVHGSAAALARLAAAPGVVGVEADHTITPTSYTPTSSKSTSSKSTSSKSTSNKPASNKPTSNKPTSYTPTPTKVVSSGQSAYAWQGLGDEAGRMNAGRGVTVALIDTGVSDTPYLNRASGHLVDGIDTSGLVTGGDVQTSGVFKDGYGHGTFMASLIAGGSQVRGAVRGLGVAPGATVDVVKVAGDDGASSLASMMTGLNWVAINSSTIQIANLSFGLDPSDVGGYGQDPLNLAVETLRSLGVNMVVSAGNTAGQVTDPGFDPRVITVGAANTVGWWPTVASFSGSAVVAGVSKPDLVAAGVNIYGELPAKSTVVSQNPQALQPNGLYRGSGTSEATAIVSGLAAITVSDFPHASTDQVKASLRVAATPMLSRGAGAGLANAVQGLARPLDDWRMGDGGALNEATFSSNSWRLNQFGVDIFGANGLVSSRWGSSRWGSDAFDALSFDSSRWGSSRWGSSRWGSSRWGSSRWGSSRWGASSWGSESWGDDGGGE
jgi:serine protease AprX